MNRKECLDAAAACVLKDRADAYGGPEQSFRDIAYYWNGHLAGRDLAKNPLHGGDVAVMMGLLKIARLKANPYHKDSAVDWTGYGATYFEALPAQPSAGE